MVNSSAFYSKGRDMSPNKDDSSKMERTKKKVEWSSSLSSIEPQTTPDYRSPTWDSETGHLLSYFLEDSGQQGTATLPTQVSMTGNSAIPSQSKHPPLHPFSFNVASQGTTKHLQPPVSNSGARSSNNATFDDEDDGHLPPSTPATQYYHQNANISKIKESLVSPRDNPHTMEDISISPAAFWGESHEPLMLPPPSPNHPSEKSTATTDRIQQQKHLEWLQHINEMAKQAFSGNNATQQHPHLAAVAASHPQQPPAAAHPQYPSNGIPVSSHPVGMPVHQGYPTIGAPMFYSHLTQIQQQSQGESEEKRVRRLERNRESARKSRRRKKERLSHLEEKVSGLHAQIETERLKQINSMDDILLRFQKERISHLKQDMEDNANSSIDWNQRLSTLVQMTGPYCPVRRAVIDFQYAALKDMLLPPYQKFLLWLTLHPERYFTTGKEQRALRERNKVSSGKISSKQVGDELTNGRKLEDGTIEPPQISAGEEKGNQTAQAFDATRMWPLLCYELSVSVDQEERFMQAHKRIRQGGNLSKERSQIAAAIRMASSLKEAVLYQSYTASMRGEKFYSDILTPQQTVLYQDWLSKNRARCQDVTSRRKEKIRGLSPIPSENTSLLEICGRLEEILKISKEQKD